MTYAMIEVVDGDLTGLARDALALAVTLPPVTAVSATDIPEPVIAELAAAGVTDVLFGGAAAGADETVGLDAVVAGVIADAADAHEIVVVTPPNGAGREVAGRLAVRLSAPIVTAVDSAVLRDDGLFAEVSDGSHRVTVEASGRTAVLVVRPRGAVARADEDVHETDEASAVPVSRVVRRSLASAGLAPGERVHATTWTPHSAAAENALERARIVVVGGRGLGSPAVFDRARAWARGIGAAFGSSRAPVEAGWASYDELVGQTGTTIAPDVYLSFGVAGAPQHRAGMRESRIVAAVNSDPGAPIFDDADLAVVGDAETLLAALERFTATEG